MQENKPGSLSLGCLFPSQTLVPYLHSIYVASCLSCYLSTWHKSNYFVAKAAAAGKVKEIKLKKKTLTLAQNCINNYLSGNMKIMLTLCHHRHCQEKIPWVTSSHCVEGKDHFLAKWFFAGAHNAGFSGTHPALPGIISTVPIYGAQHAKQIEDNSLPRLQPGKTLFLSCQRKQCREEGAFFLRETKATFLPKKGMVGSEAVPQLHACRQTSFPPS